MHIVRAHRLLSCRIIFKGIKKSYLRRRPLNNFVCVQKLFYVIFMFIHCSMCFYNNKHEKVMLHFKTLMTAYINFLHTNKSIKINYLPSQYHWKKSHFSFIVIYIFFYLHVNYFMKIIKLFFFLKHLDSLKVPHNYDLYVLNPLYNFFYIIKHKTILSMEIKTRKKTMSKYIMVFTN